MDRSSSLDPQERERERENEICNRNSRRIYVAVFRNADGFY